MDWIHYLLDLVLHLDKQLVAIAHQTGGWLYLILFLIVFCETGLVVTPFLPGDSLLFMVGALAANPAFNFSLPLLLVLLCVAAILGDAVNYYLGYRIGPKVFRSESSWLLNKQHLLKAQAFYEKYGAKAIVLARFVPIVRTFAPFVAGIGKMHYPRFAFYNVAGGLVWVLLFTLAGYFFGGREWVQKNFTYVIGAIILISILPMVFEYLLARRRASEQAMPPRLDADPSAAPAPQAAKQA